MKALLGLNNDGLNTSSYKLLNMESDFLFTRFYVEYKDKEKVASLKLKLA